jgi:hypothetical protein
MHHGPILFVNGIGDDGTTCVFSRGCCEVNGTVVKDGSGGLTHLRKYDFLNLVKTNIPLRFKKIMHIYQINHASAEALTTGINPEFKAFYISEQ